MSMLLVESDPLLAVTLPAMLTGKGYCVHVVRGISEGEDGILAQGHDLILIDVMPPDRRGTELCRSLRRQGVAVPIMMLSESDATADKVAALDAGADDCLTKPYQLEELLARLRSLVRRWQATGVSELRCGDLIMDLIRRDVTLVGAAIKLTTKELVLLEYMMRNPRRLLTRAMISENVWDMNYEPNSNVVDVYVASLRRKLDRGYQDRSIETITGRGYRFRGHGVDESLRSGTEPTAPPRRTGRGWGRAVDRPISSAAAALCPAHR